MYHETWFKKQGINANYNQFFKAEHYDLNWKNKAFLGASSTTSGGSNFHSLCGNGLGIVLDMTKFMKSYGLQSWQDAQTWYIG